MNRKFTWFVTPLLLACLHLAEAQQLKPHRIGFLGGSSASAYSGFIEAFQQAMRALGYTEGTNYVLDYQLGDGRLDRLPQLAAELVRLDVDVIVVSGARATSQMKTATKTIPIVMTAIEEPVAMGIIQSLARPGGNITGLTNLAPELSGKRLELLKEVLPKTSRVAVLWPPDAAGAVVAFKETQQVAASLGLEIQ